MHHSALLVFTDLDGSLLDHHNYDWTPAARWLNTLRAWGVPVIINTSKTLAEVRGLALELNLTDYPNVTENGGAIWLPPHWQGDEEAQAAKGAIGQALDNGRLIHLGGRITDIRRVLVQLREQGFRFEGFGDVTPDRVAAWTGLAPEKARLAWQRESSEPLRWHDSEARLADFAAALESHGLALTRGGRFLHVLAQGVNKGRALAWLTAHYQTLRGRPSTSLALGDGNNDIPMLAAADLGVLVRNPGSTIALSPAVKAALYHTRSAGPQGWCEGLDYWQSKGFQRG